MAVKVERVSKNLKPYTYVRSEMTRTVKGEELHFFSYGALDAHGLIGPEFNGIAVGNKTKKCIVTDELFTQTSGWYPGFNDAAAEFAHRALEELAAMPEELLYTFLTTSRKFRMGSLG